MPKPTPAISHPQTTPPHTPHPPSFPTRRSSDLEPDGYTLLAAQPAPLTTNVVMYKKLSFDPAAFEPLAIMTSIPNTLTVRLDLPAASVADLIAYAKANPGKL